MNCNTERDLGNKQLSDFQSRMEDILSIMLKITSIGRPADVLLSEEENKNEALSGIARTVFWGNMILVTKSNTYIYIYSVVVSLIHKMPSSLDLRRILDWISHFYPGKLRWNPNMAVWKMISFSIGSFVGSMFIFQGAYNPSQKWSTWSGQWSSQHWGRWCRRQFFFWRGKAPSPIPSMYCIGTFTYIYLNIPWNGFYGIWVRLKNCRQKFMGSLLHTSRHVLSLLANDHYRNRCMVMLSEQMSMTCSKSWTRQL